jgi:hypothetical protein
MIPIEMMLAAVVVYLWLVPSILLVPVVASRKGESGGLWAFVAIIFSPPLALLALAAIPHLGAPKGQG